MAPTRGWQLPDLSPHVPVAVGHFKRQDLRTWLLTPAGCALYPKRLQTEPYFHHLLLYEPGKHPFPP